MFDLAVYISSCGDYGELRHLRLVWVDLLVVFGVKAGLFTSWIIYCGFTTAVDMLPDHLDERPGICHSI